MDKNLKILENLSLERLEESFNSISEFPNKEDEQGKKRRESYKNAYPFFVQYFKGVEEIKEKDLVIAAHFVYGWMPRVLTLKFDNIEDVLKTLNKAKQNVVLDEKEIQLLMVCINNSLVGVSKVLHFINPNKYAIWDSNIYAYLKNEHNSKGKNKQSGIKNVELYLGYLRKLDEIAKQHKFQVLYEAIKLKIKYAVTPMRAIEYVMFHAHPKSEFTE
jgi:hypothetical protein